MNRSAKKGLQIRFALSRGFAISGLSFGRWTQGGARQVQGRDVLHQPSSINHQPFSRLAGTFTPPSSLSVLVGLLLLVLLPLTGCVTKSQADAQAHAAYMAGQKAAYKAMDAQLKVVVLGEVQKHVVPWVDGLTLAQAIATANYQGLHDPKDILIQRNGSTTDVSPKTLLNGQSIILQPGDVITVIGQ